MGSEICFWMVRLGELCLNSPVSSISSPRIIHKTDTFDFSPDAEKSAWSLEDIKSMDPWEKEMHCNEVGNGEFSLPFKTSFKPFMLLGPLFLAALLFIVRPVILGEKSHGTAATQFVLNNYARYITTPEQWIHALSFQNPVDIASRGTNGEHLADFWFHGPDLHGEKLVTSPNFDLPDEDIELRRVFRTSVESRGNISNRFSKFSTLKRLVRGVARIQYLADQFWIRWGREHLHSLQPRRKWTRDVREFKPGDVVLVKDQWPLAVVDSNSVSHDVVTRRVRVRMSGTPKVVETPVDLRVSKKSKQLEPTFYSRPAHGLFFLVSGLEPDRREV